MANSRRRAQRGNVILESALVLVVILFIVVGTMDMGRMMFTHETLADRVRAGAKWASVNSFDAAKIRNVVVYGTPEAGTQPVMSDLSPALVSADLIDPNTTRARVEVRITNFPFSFFLPLLGGSYAMRPIAASITHEPTLQ